MYMRCLRHVARKSAFAYFSPYAARFYSTTKTSAPLRILFCGSDKFSIASLQALHKEHKRDPQLIESIDVLCRPGKPAGRGLKTIREVPIKAAAIELGLRLHEKDTFTGWDLPETKAGPINLIIAVSFGLFIPQRILESVKYGGLNLHPSLLPDFRGPAPLQYTIMRGEHFTGVTLQTLHPTSFDHGTILAQTPAPGLSIPDPLKCTTRDLLKLTTPVSANMLVQGIRDRLFVPPLEEVIPWHRPEELVHAAKITMAHREVDWMQWSWKKFDRYSRALGRLFNNIYADDTMTQRVVYEEYDTVPTPASLDQFCDMQEIDDKPLDSAVHSFWYERLGERGRQMYVVDGDAIIVAGLGGEGMCLRVKKMSVEGGKKRSAMKVMRKFMDGDVWELEKREKEKEKRKMKMKKKGEEEKAKEEEEVSDG